MPPGWSHDGSRKGSEGLKADYVKAEFVTMHPETAGMPGLPVDGAQKARQPIPAE
jgi:hypothetical protein